MARRTILETLSGFPPRIRPQANLGGADHRVHIFTRDETGLVYISAHSAGAYTATLLVMVNAMKGGGVDPPPTPAWANFTLVMECTPESGNYHSVHSVVLTALSLLFV
jgi:hypothetical protein